MEINPEFGRLREGGYCLLPLPARSKDPPPKGWVEQREPYEVPDGANLAIGTRGEIAILITNDDQSTSWASAQFGPPNVRSKRGGHWYFRARKGQANEANKVTLVGMMEFHSKNKYALIPPSIHPNGTPYRWERPLLPLKGLPEAPDLRELWHPAGTHHDKLLAMSAAKAHNGEDAEVIFAELSVWRDGHLPDRHAHPDKELRQLSESAFAKFHAKPRSSIHHPEEEGEEEATQLELAREFLATRKMEFRVDTTTERWRYFDGRCWGEDHLGRVTEAMTQQVDSIVDDRKRQRASSNAYISGSLSLASSLPSARVDAWDVDGWLLPTRTGTLDLRTGTLCASSPADLLTRCAEVDWRGLTHPAPRWEDFISWATRGSEPLAEFLQRSAGYWLTGDVLAQKWWLFWGKGGNGKDVFLTCMAGTQGGYAQLAQAATFLYGTDADLVDRALSSMRGARLVYISETMEMARLNETLIKALTGKPTQRVRPIYGVDYEMRLQMKLVMATNHRPNITDESDGTWRRVLSVPFLAQVKAENVNEHLAEELLKEESSGILAWRVRGLLSYLKVGLLPPVEVTASRDDYREESDLLGQYLKAATTPTTMGQPKVQARENYRAFWVWMTERGEKPWPETRLGRRLKDRGVEFEDSRVGRYWNLTLTDEGQALLSRFSQHELREEGPSGPRRR